ncbi:MAG: AAC(3) family N-acetyltransferase [Phycisphaerae bacterium]|nr:AAC(3) family N-acetyltransferase [Phycisphaerae bacterium]
MAHRAPRQLRRFCRDALPLLHRSTQGKRLLDTVKTVVETDRWNSFDRFHLTTQSLARRYEEAGATVQIHPVPTGGAVGSGRWVIPEATDVRSATLDILRPIRKRLLDWRQNPWHAVMWSAATPPAGLSGRLVVIDDLSMIHESAPGSLAGRILLTRLNPRPLLRALAKLGIAAALTDQRVPNHPDAVAWTRLGWGGLPLPDASRRLVALAMSANQGGELRRLYEKHPVVALRAKVDIRPYVGTHDVVSAVILGRDDPQDEVWALAHTAEPGAVDNASGVAVSLEIAHVINGLIDSGKLPRPRRSIRLVNAFECYGFFAYLEQVPRFQAPLAGVVIDSVGVRPTLCDRLEWHGTIPMSAGFVNRIGRTILNAALRIHNPGYRCVDAPFVSTSDTLIGDPIYGFPCPWLTSSRRAAPPQYDAYHSSADIPSLLSAAGLRTCAAAMAAYLYYLADAASDDVIEIADAETTHSERQIQNASSVSERRYLHDQHRVSLRRLQRWIWGGNRSAVLSHLQKCQQRIEHACGPKRIRRERPTKPRSIPRRTAPLTVCLENVPEPVPARIRQSGLVEWSMLWADGNRDLTDIADALSNQLGRSVTVEQVDRFAEACASIGYVELMDPRRMITRRRLVRDLRRLGVRRGMDLMVHSSLSKIGPVVGGPETVVDALLDVLTPGGTLLMPSFNHGSARVFNPAATPTNNGAIPEAMWRRPDAVRSLHPSHSIAAIGPKAETYCRHHLEVGIWAPDSPIGRLVHGGGYILCLGVTHTRTTAYHVAEISLPCPCIDMFGNTDRLVMPDGKVHDVPGLAWRSRTCPVPTERLDKTLDRRRLQRHGDVGLTRATLVKAIDLWHVRREHLGNVCPSCPIRPDYRD